MTLNTFKYFQRTLISTLLLPYLHDRSNFVIALLTRSQQLFCCLTYTLAATLLLPYLHDRSNFFVALLTRSQQLCYCLTYTLAATFLLPYLHARSNFVIALLTRSQQLFCCLTYTLAATLLLPYLHARSNFVVALLTRSQQHGCKENTIKCCLFRKEAKPISSVISTCHDTDPLRTSLTFMWQAVVILRVDIQAAIFQFIRFSR